jgi:hypothetical protein
MAASFLMDAVYPVFPKIQLGHFLGFSTASTQSLCARLIRYLMISNNSLLSSTRN